jgi:hypothetical protein
MPVLLTTISHLMGETTINVCDDHIETCVLYCAIIANPATGKSSGLSLIKKAVREVEIFNKVDLKNSKLVNGKLIYLLL